MASFEETELTISGVQADRTYNIGTNWSKHINRLDKKVEEGRARLLWVKGEWHEYQVDEKDFNPIGGFKRQVSEEQRAALSERMRNIHSKA